jgi:hypothetical protein
VNCSYNPASGRWERQILMDERYATVQKNARADFLANGKRIGKGRDRAALCQMRANVLIPDSRRPFRELSTQMRVVVNAGQGTT